MYENPALNPAGDKPMLKKYAVLLSLICASLVGSGALMFDLPASLHQRIDNSFKAHEWWYFLLPNHVISSFQRANGPVRGPGPTLDQVQELARELDKKINAAK
jgi:hypothetical protein